MKPLFALVLLAQLAIGTTIEPQWQAPTTRPWTGPDLWANPAEDWLVKNGHLENIFSGGNRNLVLLTAELTPAAAAFTIRCRVDQISSGTSFQAFTGIQAGLNTPSGDFRDAAVYGTGFCVGLQADGTLCIGSVTSSGAKVPVPFRQVTLEFQGTPTSNDLVKLSLTATDSSGQLLSNMTTDAHPSWLPGLIAFTASAKAPPAIDISQKRPSRPPAIPQDRGGDVRMAFDRLLVTGEKAAHHPTRRLGPILWVTHTPSNDGSVRLLIQAVAYAPTEKHDVALIIDGKPSSSAALDATTRTAKFTLRRLDLTTPHSYEVTLDGDSFKGTIHPLPKGRPVILAALSNNDSSGFPDNDLVASVAAHKPDVIAFLGNQIYETSGGYAYVVDQHPNERTLLSYLRKYTLHGWTWRELLRNTPSLTLPDHHDVFHGNLWGCGGKLADVSKGYGVSAQDSGGYKMAPQFVNTVHTTQTGNLPSPIDPAAADNQISVFFTQWQYGPLDMAILADHQFKSAPTASLADAKIENGWPKDPACYLAPPPDDSKAELLGPRQEAFLTRWADKSDPATPIRLVLSQAVWAAPLTLPAAIQSSAAAAIQPPTAGAYPADDQPKPDFGSNGWPQTKRKLAVGLIKKAGALHLTGNQQPASSGQYGLTKHRDGPWWITTPAMATPLPQRWMPATKGGNPRPGDPRECGDFNDAFGNKITLAAAANPFNSHPAFGYTILTCDPASGRVTLANWPAAASPAKPAPNNAPFPGWPITINPKSGTRY
jgi:hypothetical protein